MGKGKSFNVFKRDTLLLEFMKKHRGEENIATSHEIEAFLKENGYKVKRNNIGSLINKIMYEWNAPICYSNVKGYYWATKREEIEKTIADLESRRNALQEHIDHLRNFII